MTSDPGTKPVDGGGTSTGDAGTRGGLDDLLGTGKDNGDALAAPTGDRAVDPPKSHIGGECPMPFGKDVRFLVNDKKVLSGDRGNWIGQLVVAEKAVTRSGNVYTASDFTKDGVRYVFCGWAVETNKNPVVRTRSVNWSGNKTLRGYYIAVQAK